MKGPSREEKSLAQLARLARTRAEELQSHVADLEAARASADTALDWLAQAMRAEDEAERASAAAMRDFTRYLEGSDLKRTALEATREKLASEITASRQSLSEAYAELKKLEHLLEMRRRASAKAQSRAEAAREDAVAVMRRGR